MKQTKENSLLDRVVLILEQARTNVVRAVNSNMVIAYWLIGREIVQELQGGDVRAEYGKQVIENLSKQLTLRYGSGFSITTLQYFRKFYQVYTTHTPIPRPTGAEFTSADPVGISRPAGAELIITEISSPTGSELSSQQKLHPSSGESVPRFDPQLTWSHYRVLMRVAKPEARLFYEKEAVECGWSKAQLERQIHTPTTSGS